jgi:hypothetical protein
MDAENQRCSDVDAKKRGFVRAGKMPLPLRRKVIVPDGLKIVLCFAIFAYGHCSLPAAFFGLCC